MGMFHMHFITHCSSLCILAVFPQSLVFVMMNSNGGLKHGHIIMVITETFGLQLYIRQILIYFEVRHSRIAKDTNHTQKQTADAYKNRTL